MKVNHREAFCLMQYASKDGTEIEYIWNTRDGVTPFTVRSRRGTELWHVDWQGDRCIPGFVPQPGSRVFVNMAPRHAEREARAIVARDWDNPAAGLQTAYASPEDAVARLAEELFDPTQPRVEIVE